MNECDPIVSIIVPAYNEERYIANAINTVLNQTFTNYELIIVDDGSTDDTLKISQSFNDKRIFIVSQSKSGLSAARNKGLSLARGQFVSFLDADDCWTKDKLETQMAAFQEYPWASVIYSFVDYVDAEGKFLRMGTHIAAYGMIYEKALVRFFLNNFTSNAIIRRKCFFNTGLFDETLTAAEDWDMLIRLSHSYMFACVRKVQVSIMVRPFSLTANVQNQEKESLKVIEKSFRDAPLELVPLKKEASEYLNEFFARRCLEGHPSRQSMKMALEYIRRNIRAEMTFERVAFVVFIYCKCGALFIFPVGFVQKVFSFIERLYIVVTFFPQRNQFTNMKYPYE